jgi:hypothetical protein
MSEKSEEERIKAALADFNAALNAGEPLWSFPAITFTNILEVGAAIRIQFVFAKSPDNRAVVGELVMSLETAGILKSALAMLENIPDIPLAKRLPQSSN